MSRRLVHAAIGAGITLSLLGWGAGQIGQVALRAIDPAGPVAAQLPHAPHVSIHLSIEVRP